jgi:hypothetical protein
MMYGGPELNIVKLYESKLIINPNMKQFQFQRNWESLRKLMIACDTHIGYGTAHHTGVDTK